VFTDKLVAKIPSTHDGVIKSIKYKNDDVCLVGRALVEIEVEEDNTVAASLVKTTNTDKAKEAETSTSSSDESGITGRTKLPRAELEATNSKALATPAVRSIARRHSIDISKVPATGKDGRVMKEDITNFIAGKTSAAPTTACDLKRSASVSGTSVKMTPLTGVRPEDEVKKLTGMKKAMTKTMTESRSIPFFTFQDEIDATNLMQLRQLLKKNHKNLTLLPFFVKAASLAMSEYPIINSNTNPETDEDGFIKEYVIKKNHNFSIAIDSKDGLTVPNLKKVQEKSILQIN
jgi:2-oxoisovalerate dehydrogenase E2 component (dihydrolipoyl transacylase)